MTSLITSSQVWSPGIATLAARASTYPFRRNTIQSFSGFHLIQKPVNVFSLTRKMLLCSIPVYVLKQTGLFAVSRTHKISLVYVILSPQNNCQTYLSNSRNSCHWSAPNNPLPCYHHLFQYWHNIYLTYLCVYFLPLSFLMAEVFLLLLSLCCSVMFSII